jgi:hypothetical protein
MSASLVMKCGAAMRVLAYCCLADAIDNNVHIGEERCGESLQCASEAL